MKSNVAKSKICTVCHKQYKPTANVSKYCNLCRKEAIRKQNKEHYWRYKTENPEEYKKKRARYRKNGDLRDPLRNRKRSLKLKYGITLEDFDKILKKQGGVCAICQGKPQKKNYVVDHDHNCCPIKKRGQKTCGKCIRGLLCDRCNTALGRFYEDINILKRAVKYLEKGYINLKDLQ